MESTSTYFQKPCSAHGSYQLVSWLAPYLVSPRILGNRCCTCRHEMPVPSPGCASRESDQQFWKLDMDIHGRGMMLQTFLGEQKPASGDEASECHAGDHRLSAILCPCKPRRPDIGIHLERVQLSEGLRKDEQSFNPPGTQEQQKGPRSSNKESQRTNTLLPGAEAIASTRPDTHRLVIWKSRTAGAVGVSVQVGRAELPSLQH
jgi:hypothetical protein